MRRPSPGSRGVPRRMTRIATAARLSRILLLAAGTHDDQHYAHAQRAEADPQRDAHRFLLAHGQLERADLGLMGLFREAELLVDEAERAGDDQQYANDSGGIHRVTP